MAAYSQAIGAAARDYARRKPHASFEDVAHVDRVANLLDSRFSLLGVRFGYDALLGLVPGIGDLTSFAISSYLVAQAWRMGARKRVIARMLLNLAGDTILGAIPILGTFIDVGWKANRRNALLLRRELIKQGELSPTYAQVSA